MRLTGQHHLPVPRGEGPPRPEFPGAKLKEMVWICLVFDLILFLLRFSSCLAYRSALSPATAAAHPSTHCW